MKNTKIKLVPNLIIEKIEEEAYLYNPERDEIFSLNDVGLLMMESLRQKEMDAKEIVKKISENFSGAEGIAVRKDVGDFILVLEKNKLIRPRDSG